MIPKVIHYCWFGGNPLPEVAVKCINSWKKYFPDYEIKEWNETNFNLNCCEYVKEAFSAKKWAFVSDYARFWILYNYGGLYFDTDVEVIKDMKNIIINGPFMGCELSDMTNTDFNVGINPGLGIGAYPKMDIYKEILESYDNAHFINSDGSYNFETTVDRTTSIFKLYGFNDCNCVSNIKEINIYPPEYFCPLNYATGDLYLTKNSYSIHWYDASWLDKRMKTRRLRVEKIHRLFKGKIGNRLSKFYMSCSYYCEWIAKGDLKTIKYKLKNRIKRK